ncbi:hypothetical protein BO71DRAFT_397418 [Aspergillus ellipticus CBS 707.79]|uniref:Zn(2)-C6 fungal-type domain-containing protein n=1 Tax=Aspergillus ellipticus CBS 707.79 TaxID=1448320 RepID=A0A319DFN7_9EURO|nr:hypothetical protein BO71DRAFT_397418 [Aspergillus ellipticus CBS 707.79]
MQRNPKKRPRSSPDADLLPACNQCRSRKVRCDRVQPECSTCRKANVPCDFSASFKRVNPAKQLLHDFSAVLSRLDHVDRTLARLSQQVDSLSSPSGAIRTPETSMTESRTAKDGIAEEVTTKQIVETEDSGERVYGYPAALCLFRASQKLLWTALGGYPNMTPMRGALAMAADRSSLRPSLVRHSEVFPFRGKCMEPPVTSDQAPISLPPLAVLEAAIPCYLESINAQIPVFDAGSLHATIQACYQALNVPVNPVWAVCFNSIVLLVWNLEARAAQRLGSALIDPWENKAMTALLFANCRRGLADLERLSQPTLGNVQALILLTLVARDFFHTAVFEKVCQTACQVARSMGLNRSVETLEQMEDNAQLRTRQRLFWILYSLDKQRVFLSGQSCDLYLFDSDFQPRRCNNAMLPASQLQSAAVQMMTIWEEIYLCLYSSRAARFGAEHRRDQIRALRRMYEDFTQQQEELLSPSFLARAPELCMMQLELKYCYHVGQVLIYRCDQSEESRRDSRKHSVQALRAMSDVFHAPVTAHSCAVLSRMFQNYPLISFHDLCIVYLISTNADEVAPYVSLLDDVREQLGTLRHPEFPTNYVVKLHQGVSWCTDLMELVKQAVSTPESSESHYIVTPPATSVGLESELPCAVPDPGYEALVKPLANPFEGVNVPEFFFDPVMMENFFADQFRMA